MKKNLQRVLGMVVAIIGFTYNLCYADLIDPDHPSLPRSEGNIVPGYPSLLKGEGNIVPMIIIGVVIAAIIILAKSKKEKDKEKNDEK